MAQKQVTIVCKRCRCDEIRVSHRRWYEHPLSWLGLAPFRCMACQTRFFRPYGGQQRF